MIRDKGKDGTGHILSEFWTFQHMSTEAAICNPHLLPLLSGLEEINGTRQLRWGGNSLSTSLHVTALLMSKPQLHSLKRWVSPQMCVHTHTCTWNPAELWPSNYQAKHWRLCMSMAHTTKKINSCPESQLTWGPQQATQPELHLECFSLMPEINRLIQPSSF
jgi:hypothetical protein